MLLFRAKKKKTKKETKAKARSVAKKVFTICKSWITDGIVELDTEVYLTEEERDRAWNALVLAHNNMIIDAYEIKDLNYIPDKYCYMWNDQYLEFYHYDDIDCDRQFFCKSEDFVKEK